MESNRQAHDVLKCDVCTLGGATKSTCDYRLRTFPKRMFASRTACVLVCVPCLLGVCCCLLLLLLGAARERRAQRAALAAAQPRLRETAAAAHRHARAGAQALLPAWPARRATAPAQVFCFWIHRRSAQRDSSLSEFESPTVRTVFAVVQHLVGPFCRWIPKSTSSPPPYPPPRGALHPSALAPVDSSQFARTC